MLISTREAQPLTLVEVENNGCFFDESVIDSKMVDGRRFRAAVSVVMIQNVLFADWLNLARVTDLTSTNILKYVQIFALGNFHWIASRATRKNQNRGLHVHGTQHSPICLAFF